ncbi:unnamed protein product [Cyprideis torosa]|uniref:Uncharacterized protein n=1 Tax=Cyprideis torosa TaxID=163714 RepID=A0A7R8WUE7_9CRUS|nr:unnamed protein product [Cyprideis torosa]CAG0906857.1 unnamed protein product [Cyprideis torosa]
MTRMEDQTGTAAVQRKNAKLWLFHRDQSHNDRETKLALLHHTCGIRSHNMQTCYPLAASLKRELDETKSRLKQASERDENKTHLTVTLKELLPVTLQNSPALFTDLSCDGSSGARNGSHTCCAMFWS